MSVLFETSLGDIVIDLLTKDCPKASQNFLKLCKIKYYDNCLFYNVQKNFVAQTGDPTNSAKGGESIFSILKGGDSKYFEDEIRPQIKHKRKGVVAMANDGKNLNGSRFYVTLGENISYLDGKHTIFGHVEEGLDVLEKINKVYTDDNGRPMLNVRIKRALIIDDPFPDPLGLIIPNSSPVLVRDERPEADEYVDERKVKTEEEIEEDAAKAAAKSQESSLIVLGDIPHADVKPPDNVLFVCKLNPLTQEEDLELIFSRFGTILSCNIVKDSVTGASLQYGFIEFSTAQECEHAYLRMDNVLIDDRRIHVDFSQSVAHLYRGLHA